MFSPALSMARRSAAAAISARPRSVSPTPGMRPASTPPPRLCWPWRSRCSSAMKSACLGQGVYAALELAEEAQHRRVGEGQHLGQDYAGDAACRIEPVIAVEDAGPADRAGAAAVRSGLQVDHVAEAPADRGARKQVEIVGPLRRDAAQYAGRQIAD